MKCLCKGCPPEVFSPWKEESYMGRCILFSWDPSFFASCDQAPPSAWAYPTCNSKALHRRVLRFCGIQEKNAWCHRHAFIQGFDDYKIHLLRIISYLELHDIEATDTDEDVEASMDEDWISSLGRCGGEVPGGWRSKQLTWPIWCFVDCSGISLLILLLFSSPSSLIPLFFFLPSSFSSLIRKTLPEAIVLSL